MVLRWRLKARNGAVDREENTTLDRVMEYVGVVRMELANMLVSVNLKVEVLEP